MINLHSLLKETIERRTDGDDRNEDTLKWLDGKISALHSIAQGFITKDNLEEKKATAMNMMKNSEGITGEPDQWLRGYILTLDHFHELEF